MPYAAESGAPSIQSMFMYMYRVSNKCTRQYLLSISTPGMPLLATDLLIAVAED